MQQSYIKQKQISHRKQKHKSDDACKVEEMKMDEKNEAFQKFGDKNCGLSSKLFSFLKSSKSSSQYLYPMIKSCSFI